MGAGGYDATGGEVVSILQGGMEGPGRHGHGLWPSWFVAIMVVAVTEEENPQSDIMYD